MYNRFNSLGKPRPKKVTRHLDGIGGPKIILASSFELRVSNHHINDKVHVGYSTMTLNSSDSQLRYSGQDICPKVPITWKDRSQFNENRAVNSKLNPNAMTFIIGKQWFPSNSNSNSNSTFIALNLRQKTDSKAHCSILKNQRHCRGQHRGESRKEIGNLGWVCFSKEV